MVVRRNKKRERDRKRLRDKRCDLSPSFSVESHIPPPPSLFPLNLAEPDPWLTDTQPVFKA